MKSISLLAGLLVSLSLAGIACKVTDGSSGGSQPAPPASTVTAASTPARPTGPIGPTMGGACSPGADSIACAPGGTEEVTCAGGVWRTVQTCRGPAGCKGVGSALRCDVGTPQPGDSCLPGAVPARCSGAALASCIQSKWTEVACPAQTTCKPGPGGASCAK